MAMEGKSRQHTRISISPRNTSSLGPSLTSSGGNPSSSGNNNNGGGGNTAGGGYQSHHSHHHLNRHDGPPKLRRRNSGSSTESSNKNPTKSVSEHSKNNNKTEKNIAMNTLFEKKTSKKPRNPLRVLGIALIVDQKGSEARLLARYPTSQDSVKKDEDEEHENGLYSNSFEEHEEEIDDDGGNGDDRCRHGSGDDNLFFTLTARQMAKLFRTKRSLCNQPMTLRVNKTIFCCYAVLLEETQQQYFAGNRNSNYNVEDSSMTVKSVSSPASSSTMDSKGDEKNDDDKEDNRLRLFSVVVALAPSTQQSALPFSSFWDVGGFGGVEDRSDLERYMLKSGVPSSRQNISSNTVTNDDRSGKTTIHGERKPPISQKISTNTDARSKSHDKDDEKADKRATAKNKKKQKAVRVSPVYLAIRRVHISLIRFCRALEREEHRCGYVTYQSRALFQIRIERQKEWDQIRNRPPLQNLAPSTIASTSNNNTGGGGVGLVGGIHHHTPRHSRQNSFLSTPGSGNNLISDDTLNKAFETTNLGAKAMCSVEQEQEKEQEILELMLACNPQDTQELQQNPYQKRQFGNLVRDLVAVFHSLSRNDHEYPPTPSSLLCERDAVVYVNQHFAIPIDAAGLSGHSQSSTFAQGTPLSQKLKIGSVPIAEGGLPVVRPYYTLLFPHASPSELLQTFHSSGSAPPQQLEQLLLMVNPQKPLAQTAADANLPVHTTMQLASNLIAHGACTTSPVVSSRSRLTCSGSDGILRIQELALDFSQTFPGVSLFGVVSFLTTSSRYLGESMAILVNTRNEEGTWLRQALLASPKYRFFSGVGGGEVIGTTETSTADSSITKAPQQALFPDEKDESSYSPHEPTQISVRKDLEEILFAIAVWLLSHNILVQLQEYLVAVAGVPPLGLIAPSSHGDSDSSHSLRMSPTLTAENEHRTTNAHSDSDIATNTAVKRNNSDWDESIFKELMEMEYLNGDISVMAISWRTGIDSRKLRRWGLRHKHVRVISRVPSPDDDWEPDSKPALSSMSSLIQPPSSSNASASVSKIPL